MDHVADLRMEPKELADRSFRFLKVPAKLLLNPRRPRRRATSIPPISPTCWRAPASI